MADGHQRPLMDLWGCFLYISQNWVGGGGGGGGGGPQGLLRSASTYHKGAADGLDPFRGQKEILEGNVHASQLTRHSAKSRHQQTITHLPVHLY